MSKLKKILLVIPTIIEGPYHIPKNVSRDYTRQAMYTYTDECAGPYGTLHKVNEECISISLYNKKGLLMISALVLGEKDWNNELLSELPPSFSLLTTKETAASLNSYITKNHLKISTFHLKDRLVFV